MSALLNDVEARVAGALMEKEVTTPDYYPLTVNALVAACNQSTNRHPVVRYDEPTVVAALDSLRTKGYVHVVHKSDSRVLRYRHVMREALDLDAPSAACLCVLLLRGPQTSGEIRIRTERMHAFPDIASTEQCLDALAARPMPLTVTMPRRPGQKEVRFAHLLCGAPAETEAPETDRLERLEGEVEQLRRDLAELRVQFDQLRSLLE